MKIATPPLEDAVCEAVRLNPALQKVEAAGMPRLIDKLELRASPQLECWNTGMME